MCFPSIWMPHFSCSSDISLWIPARPDVGTWKQPTACLLCAFFNLSDMMKIADDRCWYYGQIEEHLTLTRNVNSKICFHWAEENSHGVASMPLYDRYLTVWCGVAGTFEGVTSSGMQTCSITGAQYKAMLENYVIPELQQRNDIVWMHDSTPPHTAPSVPQVRQQHFDYRIISWDFGVS